MCNFCGRKPQNPGHDYCSRDCGRKAQSGGGHGGGGSSVCDFCGIRQKHAPHDYCGRTCAAKASGVSDAGGGTSTKLIYVDEQDPKFEDIVNQFEDTWLHDDRDMPSVVHVYRVVLSKALMDSYNRYRDNVEREGHFEGSRMTAGNECRRWHGTKRACTLGDDPDNLSFCKNSACSLCRILETSFRLDLFGKNTKWGRFGKGIYLSATSSKACDPKYCRNLNQQSPYKVVMLTRVAVGRGWKLTRNDDTRTAPPKGYHSVLGEPAPGGNLNYDEVVVYDNDAARPAYLVVYDE